MKLSSGQTVAILHTVGEDQVRRVDDTESNVPCESVARITAVDESDDDVTLPQTSSSTG